MTLADLDGLLARLAPLPDAVRDLVGKVDALTRALDARDAGAALLTTADAARLVGRSAAALRVAAGRDPRLAAARVGSGRALRWRRDILLAAAGGQP